MVRRRTIDLRPSTRVADSEGGILLRALNARSNHTPAGSVDAWRMCATHRTLHCSCDATCPGRSRTRRLSIGVADPSVVRLDAADNVSAALKSRRVGCRHRPACGCRILRLRLRQPFRPGASRRGRWAVGLEAAPRDLGHRGGVRWIATRDDSKLCVADRFVKLELTYVDEPACLDRGPCADEVAVAQDGADCQVIPGSMYRLQVSWSGRARQMGCCFRPVGRQLVRIMCVQFVRHMPRVEHVLPCVSLVVTTEIDTLRRGNPTVSTIRRYRTAWVTNDAASRCAPIIVGSDGPPSRSSFSSNSSAYRAKLYESVVGLVLFFVLVRLSRRKRFDGQVILSHTMLYGAARFLLEFFRGDADRGFVFGGLLSTSQFIVVILMPVAGVL